MKHDSQPLFTHQDSPQESGVAPSSLFSDSSGISSLGMSRPLFQSNIGSVSTLFHSDAYIEKLNQQLRYELGAVASYARLVASPANSRTFQDLTSAHQRASRELCCLITAHHGLPDKEAAPLFKIAETVIEIYNQLPLGNKFLLVSLANFEQHMSRRYQNIIDVAPEKDRHLLIELKRLSRRNRTALRSASKVRP